MDLREFFNFSKQRRGMDAVIFYVFHMGCFGLLSVALGALS